MTSLPALKALLEQPKGKAAAVALVALLGAAVLAVTAGGGQSIVGLVTIEDTVAKVERFLLSDDGGAASVQAEFDESMAGAKMPSCPPGFGGFADITDGTQVRVLDGSGAVVGVTTLDNGIKVFDSCMFVFTAKVPDAQIYQIEIGQRPPYTVTRAELKAQDNALSLTIK